MKQTKIVASISDRRCDQDFIRKLFFAGMNVVRMNTAHATEDGIRTIVKNVRAVSPHIGIMIDTKGPEVRTTDVKEPIHYNIGDVVKIFGRPSLPALQCAPWSEQPLPDTYRWLFRPKASGHLYGRRLRWQYL